MMTRITPMKGDPIVWSKAQWPKLVSLKLDGIRAVNVSGALLSYSQKSFPNRFTHEAFGGNLFHGLDGELIVGPANSPTVYLDTYSGIMTKTGEPDATFHVFDDFSMPTLPYHVRYAHLKRRVAALQAEGAKVALVGQDLVSGEMIARKMMEDSVNDGYEGLVFRDPNAAYKFGRSSATEGIMNKLKPLEDFEARVIDVCEGMTNNNVATKDAHGRTTRSSHQENMVPNGTLGYIVAADINTGVTFNVGIFKGVRAPELAAWWKNKDSLIGRIFKCQKLSVGEKDRPRQPRFIGWRNPIDMG